MILPSSRSHKRLSRGFTLIEVMVVVAIIGILAAIAYPSYRDYVIRGALVDATNGLSAVRADMERHFQDNRTYASVPPFVSPCLRGGGVTSGNFFITCTGALDANNYTLLADGVPGTNVEGFRFAFQVSLANPGGVQRTDLAQTGWPTCATRWLTKKGQPCV